MSGEDQIVSEKIRLGGEYVTDFVISYSARSLGINYRLIEIESPHTPAYTSAGVPSARLNTAVQQVQDWQRWIERNREEAKRLFPSMQFILRDDPNFSYMIVIGRRQNLKGNESRRNHYSRSLGVAIRTFDYLADDLMSRHFSSFTWISRGLIPYISAEDNNRFSNPFYKAYSDLEWRRLTREGEFDRSHFMARNIDLLMKRRTYNLRALADYETYLAGLTNEDKAIPPHEFRVLEYT